MRQWHTNLDNINLFRHSVIDLISNVSLSWCVCVFVLRVCLSMVMLVAEHPLTPVMIVPTVSARVVGTDNCEPGQTRRGNNR